MSASFIANVSARHNRDSYLKETPGIQIRDQSVKVCVCVCVWEAESVDMFVGVSLRCLWGMHGTTELHITPSCNNVTVGGPARPYIGKVALLSSVSRRERDSPKLCLGSLRIRNVVNYARRRGYRARARAPNSASGNTCRIGVEIFCCSGNPSYEVVGILVWSISQTTNRLTRRNKTFVLGKAF